MIFIIVHKSFHWYSIIFQLKQKVLFPLIIFNKMCTFRFNEYLKLFKSINVIFLQEKNIVWFKTFTTIK